MKKIRLRCYNYLQLVVAVRARFELWASKLQVQRSNNTATLPPKVIKLSYQFLPNGIRFKKKNVAARVEEKE